MKVHWEAIALMIMTLYDASLHWVEITGIWKYHLLYPNFPLRGFIGYDIFWTIYWTLAFLLTIKLIAKIRRK